MMSTTSEENVFASTYSQKHFPLNVSVALRRRVTELARHRCGYCLWLACPSCNQFKGTQIGARDPKNGEWVKLFNPRTQVWGEHFAWSTDGTKILGKTPCGRATVITLHLNNPEIVVTRRLWVSAKWWPPYD